ncbi:RNA polymerase beta subunit [Tanacetum coccineum]
MNIYMVAAGNSLALNQGIQKTVDPASISSRIPDYCMGTGQIFESSLGLAGDLLDRHYRIAPFDERYEQEPSRKLVKTAEFMMEERDPFEQPVIKESLISLKLIHQVGRKTSMGVPVGRLFTS